MKTLSWIIFAPFALGFLAIAWYVLWNLMPFKQRKIDNEREYMVKYARIRKLVRECPVCHKNYTWIKGLLCHLGQLPHKNHEMTGTLSLEFWHRFECVAKLEVEEMFKN
jgi:hypothetical protein